MTTLTRPCGRPRTVVRVHALVEMFEVDGLTVRLRTLAPAGRVHDTLAPTVALVHGIGMSHRSFRRSQTALAATHRTVTVDLPGFGGVPGPHRPVAVEEYADLVVAALRARGAGPLVLVGQSMGTQIVAEAARLHPEAVRSLVLVSPVIVPARRSVLLQALDLRRDGFVEGARMNAVLTTDYLRSVRQYVHQIGPMLRHRLEDTMPFVSQPVLVVRGDQDPIARRDWAVTVADAAPRGRFVELRGPHHVQERQPVAFAQLVGETSGAGTPHVEGAAGAEDTEATEDTEGSR